MPLAPNYANMDKPYQVNVEDISWEKWGKGRFGSEDRFVDQAIRHQKISLTVTRLPRGCVSCPFHFHHVSEELFLVLEGTGTLRYGSQTTTVRPADVVSCPPGPSGAHQFTNTGEDWLVYLAISTEHHETEICEYPDSGKVAAVAGNKNGHPLLRAVYRKKANVDPPKGESPLPEKPYQVNLEDLPWQTFGSPGKEDRIPGVRAQKLDLAVTRLAPGHPGCPFHFHHSSEELFYILEGTGSLRYGPESSTIRPGDVISCPPGPDSAHQITNTGEFPLVYLALSTEDFEAEVCEYPDSGELMVQVPHHDRKYGHYALLEVFRKDATVDYFDGEL